MVYQLITVALLGLAVSSITTIRILGCSRGLKSWRLPRELHHTHKAPIPRFGGLGLVAAFLCVEVYLQFADPVQPALASLYPSAVLASLLIFGLGFLDDLKPLGPKRKLAGQVLVSAALCYSGIGIESLKLPFSGCVVELGSGWGMSLTVLWLVAMTNLINFMDGMDGLAAGVCCMLMGPLCYVGHQSGSLELEAASLAGALLGFLYYNLPPARIYLGDGGAYFLGFQIGLFALLNSHKGEVCAALAAPLFVLAVPILDTTLAIVRRSLRGLPISRADRAHLHHWLLRNGLSRGKALVVFYSLTLIFLVLAIEIYRAQDKWSPALLGVLLVVVCASGIQGC
ncbi:MAG TPA: MraY family glycosyltransferase, partial [Verrucomicrobiae bacterium]|nr:MraY family glycosyltransferase [Verrucomicrobiae bacterium]